LIFLIRGLLIASAAVVLPAGCGPALGVVSGTVTIDGQPVTGGVISFVPAEGSGTPATSNIESGKYEVRTMAGKKFVQISAPHVVGKRKEYEGPDAPLVEITEERLPPKYNSQTELNFEAKAGENKQDWSLQSGK
jgi:hypothetical protein